MPFLQGPDLDYIGAGLYKTKGLTVYKGRDDIIVIPPGMTTDLASVPRLFWSLMPPNGTYENAAVVHDELCVRLADGECDISSRDVDGLFRRIAREGGTSWPIAWLLWIGVRIGALKNPVRRPGIVRDLPMMAAIALPVLALTSALLLAFGWLMVLISPWY
jgi:hypothetical protein